MIDLFYYSNFRKEMRCAKEHRNRKYKVTQGKLIFFLSICLQQNNRQKIKSMFLFMWKLTKIKTNDVISRNGKNGSAAKGQGRALISVNLICTYSVTSH